MHQLVEPITTQLGEQGMADLYATIENPLVRVLARMEHAGIAVDVADLRELARPPDERGADSSAPS